MVNYLKSIHSTHLHYIPIMESGTLLHSGDGCSPWGRWGSDTTERLHFHFSRSRIGEGNGNPLQCSCLENPRDGGAWWATIYGVAQSRTRLKWLSSSSISIIIWYFPFSLTYSVWQSLGPSMDNQQGPTVWQRELSSIFYKNVTGKRIWKKK